MCTREAIQQLSVAFHTSVDRLLHVLWLSGEAWRELPEALCEMATCSLHSEICKREGSRFSIQSLFWLSDGDSLVVDSSLEHAALDKIIRISKELALTASKCR